VLAEYSLNKIAMVAARKWVREMGDPSKTELRRLRDWLLAKVNGRDRVAPASSWQSGCPEILAGLRAMPVWPAEAFACLQPFVDHAGEITKELLSLREAQLSGFQPLKVPNWATKQRVSSPDGAGSLSHDAGDWNVFYLALHEVPFEANCARCPTTSRLLRELPRSYQHAFFSALTPGTHIVKHHGPTNKKLRVHLPLLGVEGAELRVADRVLAFQPGVPVVFDDSFEHEAWHRGPKTRVVLVFDLWHPDLSDREVFFLSFLQRSRMRAEMRADRALRQGTEGEAVLDQLGAVDAGDNFYQLLQNGKGVLSDNKWWV
jgi:aspartate beta-hydroxylase